MTDSVLAQLAALKTAPVADLKQKWRDLFDREPPPYNRRFLESRLAYRIQELAYGGLSEETIERLDAIANELEGKRGRQIFRHGNQRFLAFCNADLTARSCASHSSSQRSISL